MKKIRLFMIPHAGGSAVALYTTWLRKISPRIDIYPIELAGWGKRFGEKMYSDMDAAVTDLYQSVITLAGNRKYALFGHCMGGLLAFELAQRIQDMKFQIPEHIFISGTNIPTERGRNYYALDDQQLLDEIVKLGFSREIAKTKEFQEMLPNIRSDFKLVQDRNIRNEYPKLRSNVSILRGVSDSNIIKTDVQDWINLCENECHFYDIDGDHLFIEKKEDEVIDIINTTLEIITFIEE